MHSRHVAAMLPHTNVPLVSHGCSACHPQGEGCGKSLGAGMGFTTHAPMASCVEEEGEWAALPVKRQLNCNQHQGSHSLDMIS